MSRATISFLHLQPGRAKIRMTATRLFTIFNLPLKYISNSRFPCAFVILKAQVELDSSLDVIPKPSFLSGQSNIPVKTSPGSSWSSVLECQARLFSSNYICWQADLRPLTHSHQWNGSVCATHHGCSPAVLLVTSYHIRSDYDTYMYPPLRKLA